MPDRHSLLDIGLELNSGLDLEFVSESKLDLGLGIGNDLVYTFNKIYEDRAGDFVGFRDSQVLNLQQKLNYCSLMSSLGVSGGMLNKIVKAEHNYARLRHQMTRLIGDIPRIGDVTLSQIHWLLLTCLGCARSLRSLQLCRGR